MTIIRQITDVPTHRLLDARGAAAFLGLAYGTVHNMRAAGTFPPAIVLGPKAVRRERDDLLAWARRFKEGQR
jgi:predicted DNA-binding transcriptional regulator AlpA